MRRFFVLTLGVVLSVFLIACGSSDYDHQTDFEATEWDLVEPEGGSAGSSANLATEEQAVSEDRAVAERDGSEETVAPDQKIIYTAKLHIRVKNLQTTMSEITAQAQQLSGYIVHSYTHTTNDGSRHGELTVRVPQKHFTSFLEDVENIGSELLSRNVEGQDVTEEFVDLESRLKSLRTQENRLLEFMEQAEDTEDLLKISNDLTAIQEKIDSLTGRLRYLENRVDMATVTIQIDENHVEIGGLGEELNTWEKTVEQFKRSINWILQALSFIIVFVVGNLPILILVVIILIGGAYVAKKVRKQYPKNDEGDSQEQE